MAINFEPTIQTHTVASIFTKHIAKVIPLAFDESMSYYECICAFRDYLNSVIIPNVNNVNDAVAELQALYLDLQDAVNQEIERFENSVTNEINEFETDITTDFNNLHDFVDNYFENNFPALVSSTLDEMADDGTLENLLNDSAHLTKSYDTYTDMITDAATFTNGLRLKTLGYYSVNDGGGAEYYVSNTSSGYYPIELSNGLYLIIIVKNNSINIKQLGANNTDDIAPILQKLITNYQNPFEIFIPSGNYNCSNVTIPYTAGGITIKGIASRYIANDETKTSKITSISSVLFTIGNYDISEGVIYPYMNFGFSIENLYLKGTTSTSEIALNCIKSSNIHIYNTKIDTFSHHGILLKDCYDSIIENSTITRSGTDGTYGALELVGEISTTNAIRVNNSRFENNYLSLLIKTKTNQLIFNNCKFETGSIGADSDYMIIINEFRNSVFSNCFFTPQNNKYMIHVNTSSTPCGNFVGCQFTSPNASTNGGKFIYVTSGEGLTISGCSFYNMNKEDSLYLDKTIVTGCDFRYIALNTSEAINHPINLKDRCSIINSYLNPSTYGSGAFINISGGYNRVKNNMYANTINSTTKFLTFTSTNNELENYRVNNVASTNNDDLDALLTNTYVVGNGTTITKCDNGYNGAIINCYCNGSVTITKSSNFCSNLSANATLSAGQSFQLYFLNNRWLVNITN